MQDKIQRLKNVLLDNPSDKEALESLKVERRRKNLQDLGIFLLVFEKDGFRRIKSLLQKRGERIATYFSPREWEIIHSNNEFIEIEDEEDLSYGNSLVVQNSRTEYLLEVVDPLQIRHLEYHGRVKNTEKEFPNLKKLSFVSVLVRDNFKFDYSKLESLSFEGCGFLGNPNIKVSESLKSFVYDPLAGARRLNLSFLSKAVNLEKVWISGDDFFDPSCLTSKKIHDLHLTYCRLRSLGSLYTRELQSLNLDNNSFRTFSGDFPNLKTLSLWGNSLEGKINFEEFPSLDFSRFTA